MKDNSTGKDKDFYSKGKKMFDEINPRFKSDGFNLQCQDEPMDSGVDKNGNFMFYVFTSDSDESEFSESISLLLPHWGEGKDCSVTVHMKLRSVYENLLAMHISNGEYIDHDSAYLFESLRKDCQWIVDKINALDIRKEK